MLVTTSHNPSKEIERRTQQLAQQISGKWVARQRFSMANLQRRYGDRQVLLLNENNEWKYVEDDNPPLFFHPSSATVRMKRLLKGEDDPLIKASRVQKGDTVLDCTAGLASDSIVFSFAVGDQGQVTAIESEPMLHFLVHAGLQQYESEVPQLNEAMRRITLQLADHLQFMQKLPDQSVDVVYFDPMFRHPVEQSSAIEPLRMLVNPNAIRLEAINEARRISRKTIILKELRNSSEFSRLGFVEVNRSYSKIAYGVIHS